MQVRALKTQKIMAGMSLEDTIQNAIPSLEEQSIVAVTSKVVSITEGSFITKDKAPLKQDLITQEAEYYLDVPSEYGICLTIRNHILIPTAGIDESNADNAYILYPEDVQASAERLWSFLKSHYNLRHVGVIITDSHTTPLRRGVIGLGLGWCGFKALRDYVGTPDIFGSPLRVTLANLLDGYAAAAVVVMGEGKEQTPLAVIDQLQNIEFTDSPPSKEELEQLLMPKEKDLYAPLLEAVSWKKGKRAPS
ncbi:MAG: coenzyme F420-0:L-glutamate ligase [Candidatus Nucleicultricaceae bacterium]|jgi:putative folate metabolism gamma-glutamate ligase